MAGCCERGNEPLNSMNMGNYFSSRVSEQGVRSMKLVQEETYGHDNSKWRSFPVFVKTFLDKGAFDTSLKSTFCVTYLFNILKCNL